MFDSYVNNKRNNFNVRYVLYTKSTCVMNLGYWTKSIHILHLIVFFLMMGKNELYNKGNIITYTQNYLFYIILHKELSAFKKFISSLRFINYISS